MHLAVLLRREVAPAVECQIVTHPGNGEELVGDPLVRETAWVDAEVMLDVRSRTLPVVVRQKVYAQLCPAVLRAEPRLRFPL